LYETKDRASERFLPTFWSHSDKSLDSKEKAAAFLFHGFSLYCIVSVSEKGGKKNDQRRISVPILGLAVLEGRSTSVVEGTGSWCLE
jgi:predicted oxidoreductase